MKNSRFTVATHILAVLSFFEKINPGVLMKSHQIASSVNTNPVIIRRLLAKLQASGIVDIHGGAKGGARLQLPAEKISLLAVHEAIDEDEVFALHTNMPSEKCPIGATIKPVLAEVYKEVESSIDAVLMNKTVGDLVLDMQMRFAMSKNMSIDELMTKSQMYIGEA